MLTDQEFFNTESVTKQDIFERVWVKLTAQGVASADDTGCSYRGPNQTCCAVGHLISDEEYDPEMDRQGFIANVIRGDLAPERVANQPIDFLRDLQDAHDHELRKYDVPTWQARMREIAKTWDLKVPE